MAPRVAPSSRRRRWPWLVGLLVLVVPLAEIAVIVAVGNLIGGWPTFLLLFAESALGAWLVKREGVAAWNALQGALRSGRMPSRQLADAALVLVGGTLLLTPGFITDLVGMLVVLPLTRPVARAVLEAAIARRVLAGGVGMPRSTWGAGGPDGFGPAGASDAQRSWSRPGASTGGAEAGEQVVEGEIVSDGEFPGR